MRKLMLIITLFFLLLLAGCCTGPDGNKSFLNCFTEAEAVLCNPPPAVTILVEEAVPVISAILAEVAPGTKLFSDAAVVQAAINGLLSTGCITIKALNQIIAFLDSEAFQAKQAKMAKVKVSLIMPMVLGTKPLKDWRDGIKN